MTDHAVKWLHTVRAQDPVQPWFVYYSTGCAHAPHQSADIRRRLDGLDDAGASEAPSGYA